MQRRLSYMLIVVMATLWGVTFAFLTIFLPKIFTASQSLSSACGGAFGRDEENDMVAKIRLSAPSKGTKN